MGVASGCGEQEMAVASGSGWNLLVLLVGVVVRMYIDFLILLITTPLVSVLFCLLFVHFKKCFSFLFQYFYFMYNFFFSRSTNTHTGDYGRPTAAI